VQRQYTLVRASQLVNTENTHVICNRESIDAVNQGNCSLSIKLRFECFVIVVHNVNNMPRLYLIRQMTPKYKFAYGVNSCSDDWFWIQPNKKSVDDFYISNIAAESKPNQSKRRSAIQ